MNKHDAIQSLLEASRREQERPEEFLKSWKEAVLLIGTEFFTLDSEYVATATDKNQLRPNMPFMVSTFKAVSSNERIFLLCLCQFYCDSDTRRLCEENDVLFPSLTDIACLDDRRRDIVIRLMASYTGW